jgi:hypothetical protein
MKNSENTHDENWSQFMQQIADILKLNKEQIDELKTKQEKYGFTKTIDSILSENRSHKKLILFLIANYKKDIFLHIDSKLQSDREIALIAVRKNSRNFFVLSEELRWNKNIWFELIKSLIREEKNLFEVEQVLEQHFLKNNLNETLFNFYLSYFKKVQGLYIDDLFKWILLIKKENREFYKLFKDLNIIEWKWKKPILSEKFKKKFTKELIESEEFQNLSPEEQQEYIKKYLGNLFWEWTKSFGVNALFLIDTIFHLCRINIWLHDTKGSKQKKDNDKEKESADNIQIWSEFQKVSAEDKVDFCLNEYEYSSFSGGYTVHNNWVNKVQLSEEEVEKFTTEGLKNFIKFYNLLCDIGMNFLWDKHKTNFITLMNNKVWFSYPDWQWVTDSRATRVLNLIWKSIGMIWNDKHSQYKKEFDTIGWAKKAFIEAKGIGKIWKHTYETVSMNDDSPVEKALKYLGYIDKWVLSIGKFYDTKDKNS